MTKRQPKRSWGWVKDWTWTIWSTTRRGGRHVRLHSCPQNRLTSVALRGRDQVYRRCGLGQKPRGWAQHVHRRRLHRCRPRVTGFIDKFLLAPGGASAQRILVVPGVEVASQGSRSLHASLVTSKQSPSGRRPGSQRAHKVLLGGAQFRAERGQRPLGRSVPAAGRGGKSRKQHAL